MKKWIIAQISYVKKNILLSYERWYLVKESQIMVECYSQKMAGAEPVSFSKEKWRKHLLFCFLLLAIDVMGCGEVEYRGNDSGSIDELKCNVDVLIVFDSSSSMLDAVEPLASEAFPTFAEELTSYPGIGAVRIGVKNHLFGEYEFRNGGSGLDCEGGTTMTVQTSYLHTEGWNPIEKHDNDCCEEVQSVDCSFESGERWIEGPSDRMLSEFACVAQMPCQQNTTLSEPTLEAGLKALQFEGNAGFIREDALLVVVYITNEDDQSSMAATDIRDGLLELKSGEEKYVAVVAIAGPEFPIVGSGCIGEYGFTRATPGIIAFTELFGDHGFSYEMCGDNDMSGALAAVFDAIVPSCREIVVE